MDVCTYRPTLGMRGTLVARSAARFSGFWQFRRGRKIPPANRCAMLLFLPLKLADFRVQAASGQLRSFGLLLLIRKIVLLANGALCHCSRELLQFVQVTAVRERSNQRQVQLTQVGCDLVPEFACSNL